MANELDQFQAKITTLTGDLQRAVATPPEGLSALHRNYISLALSRLQGATTRNSVLTELRGLRTQLPQDARGLAEIQTQTTALETEMQSWDERNIVTPTTNLISSAALTGQELYRDAPWYVRAPVLGSMIGGAAWIGSKLFGWVPGIGPALKKGSFWHYVGGGAVLGLAGTGAVKGIGALQESNKKSTEEKVAADTNTRLTAHMERILWPAGGNAIVMPELLPATQFPLTEVEIRQTGPTGSSAFTTVVARNVAHNITVDPTATQVEIRFKLPNGTTGTVTRTRPPA